MKKLKYNPLYIFIFVSINVHADNISYQQGIHLPFNQNSVQTSTVQSTESLQALDSSKRVSFNSRLLYGQSNRNISLAAFSNKNSVVPGEYFVQLNVNDEQLADTPVKFIVSDQQNLAVLCIDHKLLQQLNLVEQLLAKLPVKDCLNIQDISSSAYYEFDIARLKLNIYIPQAYRVERPKNSIRPELFDKGINSSFISYNYNVNHNDSGKSEYLSLNGGINFNGLYYRHQGSFETQDRGLGTYRSYENVVHTDLIPLYSRLSIGQFSTQSYQLESLPIVGAQIASDQTMSPWSSQIYSPVIENVASSNAIVKVYQKGVKIYERTVPAGPFKITDLGSVGRGNLLIEIVENTGEVKTYTLALQQNFRLIRPGQYYYTAAVGRYHFSNKTTDELIGQLNYGYGISNNLTIFGGINASEHYKNAVIGAGVSSALGGMNLKVNTSQASLFSDSYYGRQFGLDYNYFFENKGLNIYLSSLYQSREYLTLSNTLSRLYSDTLSEPEYDYYIFTNKLKSQFSVNMTQSLRTMGTTSNLNLGYSSNKYWDSQDSLQQYSLSYSNRWRRLGYSLGYSQTDYTSDRDKDKTFYLSFSLPLEWKENRLFVNANMQDRFSDTQADTANLNISGTLGTHNTFNYGVGLSNAYQNSQSETAFQAYANYLLPKMSLGATVYSSGDHQQYSVSARGALVAHKFGVTPVNALTDTYTIVHAEDGGGARLNNAWGVKLDRFGNAIYPSASAYRENQISLNPEDLPVNVVLDSNETKVIPRKYSSTLATFKAKRISNLLLRIKTVRDVPLPIGSHLLNQDGALIGILGQSNQVILESGDEAFDQSLTVAWGNEMTESCKIPLIDLPSKKQKKDKQLQILNVECH